MNLIGNFAAKCIPDNIENFIRNVYNHFSQSPFNSSNWKILQESMNLKPYKMIRKAETRWLSLIECVDRLLIRWDELKKYFNELGKKEKHINLMFQKKTTLSYLKFIQIFLQKLTSVSVSMQSSESRIPDIHQNLRSLYNEVISYIIKDDKRPLPLSWKFQLFTRNPNLDTVVFDETYAKPDSEFLEYYEILHDKILDSGDLSESKKFKFFKNMKDFIIRLCWKMSDLLPFNDALLQDISCIYPTSFDRKKYLLLAKRFQQVLKVTMSCIENELTKFEENIEGMKKSYSELIKSDKEKALVKFYLNLEKNPSFKSLPHLAGIILALPHSSAEVERLFSQLKLIKSDIRCSLSQKTLESLILLKLAPINVKDPKTLKDLIDKKKEMNEKLLEKKKEVMNKRKIDEVNQLSYEAIKNPDLNDFERLSQERSEKLVTEREVERMKSSEMIPNELFDDEFYLE
jgi:hypothetical protein